MSNERYEQERNSLLRSIRDKKKEIADLDYEIAISNYETRQSLIEKRDCLFSILADCESDLRELENYHDLDVLGIEY